MPTALQIVGRTTTVWGGLAQRPYSMGDAGPRNDCSSFVWAVLDLPAPVGSTVDIVRFLARISWDEAQPGDVWGKLGPGTAGANGHVAVITGTPRTRNDRRWEVVQQSGPTGAYGPTRDLYWSPPTGYEPWRLATLTEEDPMASFPTDNAYTVHNLDRIISAFITDSEFVTNLKGPDGAVLAPYPNPLNLDRIATAVAAKVAVGAVDLKALAAEIKKVVPAPPTHDELVAAAKEGANLAEDS